MGKNTTTNEEKKKKVFERFQNEIDHLVLSQQRVFCTLDEIRIMCV